MELSWIFSLVPDANLYLKKKDKFYTPFSYIDECAQCLLMKKWHAYPTY